MALGKRRKRSIIHGITLLFIVGGCVFLFLGITGAWTSHASQKHALNQAKKITAGVEQPQAIPLNSETERPTIESFHPKADEVIGMVSLPTLNENLPIIQGTKTSQLKKGVGHFEKSSFPGEGNQVVLSGHRDTVFQDLGDLKKGDTVIVEVPYGLYTYSVDHAKIVKANDQSVIHPTDSEELVLTTCYPFYYVGNAPKRYIVYAYPVKD